MRDQIRSGVPISQNERSAQSAADAAFSAFVISKSAFLTYAEQTPIIVHKSMNTASFSQIFANVPHKSTVTAAARGDSTPRRVSAALLMAPKRRSSPWDAPVETVRHAMYAASRAVSIRDAANVTIPDMPTVHKSPR